MDPLVFEPYFRPQPWGGRALETYMGVSLPGSQGYGEAWVLSGQALHESRVAEGPLAGATLNELWRDRRGELAGEEGSPATPFPLLFKYLDCRDLLSIQVHPSDAIAARLRPGELGKTEAWLILDVQPTGRIYAGLRPGVTRAELERRLDDGTLAESLHSFVPKPGDCLFLKAGTVHAVGGGVLMAEVQQSSDVTFRLFDWNRRGADGKLRQLHREESLASIDWNAGPTNPAPPAAVQAPGRSRGGSLLAKCEYFSMTRYDLAGGESLDAAPTGRYSVWMVLGGNSELSCPASGYGRRFRAGETVLVPASCPEVCWKCMPGTGGASGTQAAVLEVQS